VAKYAGGGMVREVGGPKTGPMAPGKRQVLKAKGGPIKLAMGGSAKERRGVMDTAGKPSPQKKMKNPAFI
jgi:hypothetical protein